MLALLAVLYLSGRRVGLPALGLAAGAVLAKLWADPLSPMVAQAGLVIEKPPLQSVVAIGLTLLPALVLLWRSPKAHGQLARLGGGLIFALLGTTLTFSWIQAGVVLDPTSKPIIDAILPYQPLIVTIGLVLATTEILHKPHHHVPRKK